MKCCHPTFPYAATLLWWEGVMTFKTESLCSISWRETSIEKRLESIEKKKFIHFCDYITNFLEETPIHFKIILAWLAWSSAQIIEYTKTMVSIYACFLKIEQYSVKNPTILLASNHDNSSSSSCQPHALIIIPAAYSKWRCCSILP